MNASNAKTYHVTEEEIDTLYANLVEDGEAMIQTKNCFISTLLLFVLILLPAFIISCSTQQTDIDHISSAATPQPASLADLGVSIKLPEGWTEYQEPIRATLADRIDHLSEEERKTVDTDQPGKLEMGANFYSYNNLDQYGSIPEDELFGYFLTVQMHNYMSEERRALWKSGLCSPAQLCTESRNPSLILIRELGKEENPFDSGTGFLYDVKTENEDAPPRLMYMYYVVKGKRCYKIMFDGLARDLEKGTYLELLADIDFAA